MAKRFPLLNPGPVGPSGGPFGASPIGKTTSLSPFGRGRARPRLVTTLKKGGKVPRFDFGGLFGGQPGQTTTSSAVQSTGATNNNIADPQYNTLRDQTLDRAANLDFSDPNKYIAGFNADQQNAFQGVRNTQGVYQGNFNNAQGAIDRGTGTAAGIQGSAQPYVDQAGQMQTGSGAFNPFAQQAAQGANTTVGNYMSPYQQNAMDAVGAASNKAFGAPGGPMERINDTFTGGNAAQFGRERHGDVMGNAVYNQQQALDQQLAQMANTGWQSGLTAATADQNRVASLGQTAGQLANQDITTRAGLGKTTADIGTAATAANLSAGQAQEKLGLDRQGAGYTDANALLSVGNQEQQLEQQKLSMPLQGEQYRQSLGQGWQLPTSSNFLNTNNSGSSSSQSQPQGSIAGQVVGAGATILGALGGGDNNKNPDGTQKSARGGQINPFDGYATGGYVPTVTGMRKRNAMRTPPPPSPMGPMGGMGGMQPTGMPGMPPMAPPGAAALNPQGPPPPPMPHPANRRFARGGVFAGGGPFVGDEAQDRAMVERGIHQHERGMHKATTGQLTKLRLARGGGVPGYVSGGPTVIPKPLPLLGQPESPFDPADITKRLGGLEESVAKFPSAPVAVASLPFGGADAGVGTSGVGGSASDGSGGSAAAGVSGSDSAGAGSGGGDAGSGTYAGGGGVPGYRYGGLEIRGNPTPSIRGNLPPPTDQGDDTGGREVPPVNPLEWFQRANPASMGGGSYVPGQWASLPEPDPRDIPRLNDWHRRNPEWYPQYDMPNMPRGETPLPPAAVRAVVNRSAAPSARRATPSPADDEPRSGWRAWGYDPAPERAPAADRNFFDKLFSWFGGKGYHAAGGQANPLGTDSRAGFGSIYKEPIPVGKYGYARGGGVPGYAEGTTAQRPIGGDRAALDEAPSTGPFGTMLRFSPIGATKADFGHFGPLNQPSLLGGSSGSGSGSSKGDISGMGDSIAKLLKMGKGLFGSSSSSDTGIPDTDIGITSGGLMGSDPGGAYNIGDLDMSSFGGGSGLLGFAHGGQLPHFAHGGQLPHFAEGDQYAALDEDASTGPFGESIKPTNVGQTVANFGEFGPLGSLPSAGGGAGAAGGAGGGGGGGNKAGKALSGAASGAMAGMALGPWGAVGGGILGGLSGLFGAEGGQVPGYAQGGQDDEDMADFAYNYAQTSPFLSSSVGLGDRMQNQNIAMAARPRIRQQIADRRDYDARVPRPPAPMSPEMQARQDAEMENERSKGGLRRWGEQVYGDIAKPVGQMANRVGQGEYLDALEPPLTAMASMTPAAGATGMALRQTAREAQAAKQAYEAARQGLVWRRMMGR